MCPLNTLSFCCLNPHKALEVRAALLVSSLPPPFLLPTFCIKLFFFNGRVGGYPGLGANLLISGFLSSGQSGGGGREEGVKGGAPPFWGFLFQQRLWPFNTQELFCITKKGSKALTPSLFSATYLVLRLPFRAPSSQP